MINDLTLEEKAALLAGTDFMYTKPIPRLGIRSLCMADGPHGLRKQTGNMDNGSSGSEPATAFPTAVTTASSWNPENTLKMGRAIGNECRHYGVNILLGPGVNIKRNPLCGRNFEYFSEDPYLAGEMAIGEIEGIQSKGVGVSVKHFALNNGENFRFMGNSVADMRAIREIYLKVFERIIKRAKPYTVMCAYNQINGTFCSGNKWLLTDVLRNEWGFDGAVMTDWGAMKERVAAVKAGLDLEMPGDTAICRKWIVDGVNDGKLTMGELDACVENILRLIERFASEQAGGDADFKAHHGLAAEIAEDSAVLLENDGALPLSENEKLCVVGDLFEKMRYQGAGSSMINPAFITTPKQAFDEHNISYEFSRGYAENKTAPDPEMIAEAVEKSKSHDKVIVFVGLTDLVESEGADRENMRLPENQLALIDAVIKTGKKVIIVLYGGSAVELPFAEKVSAILNMFLPGQNGGTATYDLLFGHKTPCGKLAETWVKSYDDVPFGAEFGKAVNEIYRESILVGYRYYLTSGRQVRYPFGYGLSYTTFDYKDMRVKETEDGYEVSCEITDSGLCDGAEIVQLYVKGPKTDVFKPEKELRAFTKVYLKAGESKRAELFVSKSDLRYWNIDQNRWVLESGRYELQICSDCQTVKLAESVIVEGENVRSPYTEKVNTIYAKAELSAVDDEVFGSMSGIEVPPLPPKMPITLESRFTDLRQTFMGRMVYNAVLGYAEKEMKAARKLHEGPERDNMIKGATFTKRILQSNCLRSMSMTTTRLPYNFALGLVELANGHLIKGIKCFCKKIK